MSAIETAASGSELEAIKSEAYKREEAPVVKKPEFTFNSSTKDFALEIDGQSVPGFEKTFNNFNPLDSDKDIIEVAVPQPEEGKSQYLFKYLNLKNPEAQYPTLQKSDDEKKYFVNGHEWNSLTGKKLYWGGHRAAFDPEHKLTAFATQHDNKTNEVIVNNRIWKNKLSAYQLLAKEGHVGASQGEGNLYIDDQPWKIAKQGVELKDGMLDKQTIRAFDMNERTVAAVITYNREIAPRHHTYEQKVFVGDTTGVKKEWGTLLNDMQRISVDKKTDSVAVLARINSGDELTVLIDDVPCKTKETIDKVQSFEMQDGALFIQYTNPLGETVAEKFSLEDEAKFNQEKETAEERSAEMLRNLEHTLITKGLNPEKTLAMISENENLKNENENQRERIKTMSKSAEDKEIELINQLTESDKKVANFEKENKAMMKELEALRKLNVEVTVMLSSAEKQSLGRSGYVISKVRFEEIKKASEDSEKVIYKKTNA